MANSTATADAIVNKVIGLAKSQQYTQLPEPDISRYQIQVPKPDLSKFDQYLTIKQGETSYV